MSWTKVRRHAVQFASALSLIGFAEAAASDVPAAITLYTADNPPHSMRDPETGIYTGLAHDLVVEILRRANVSYSIINMPIERSLAAVESNKDSCFFILNYTPERAQRFAWVLPIVSGGWGAFVPAGSGVKIESVDDLRKYTVVTRGQIASGDYVRSLGLNALEVSSTGKMLELLYMGRAQVLIYGVMDTPRLVEAAGGKPLELAMQLTTTELGLGCNRDISPDLMTRLNAINQDLGDFRKQVLARY